jgi:hypothetical protein
MAVDTIQCPSCGIRIPMSKAVTGEIEESLRNEYEKQQRERDAAQREAFDALLKEEQNKTATKVKKEFSLQLASAQDELAAVSEKLDAANKKELALLRTQKELTQRQASLDLEVEQRVVAAQDEIMNKAAEQAAERHRIKDLEREKKLTDLAAQLDDAQRKLAQGSQQLQGEVAELDLENALRVTFPHDGVDPVGKGVRGADIIWTVRTALGVDCGQVAWESKNTKAWSDGWLTKAKDDQRARKAACVVLVSSALPKGMAHFGLVDGVWVCSPAVAIGVAHALRAQLIQVASARAAADGKDSKMENLYHYMTGTEFRQRIEALVESFGAMQQDLERERRSLQTSWAKREKQIARSFESVAGMFGEMQGIVGPTLQKVAMLELPAGAPDLTEEPT